MTRLPQRLSSQSEVKPVIRNRSIIPCLKVIGSFKEVCQTLRYDSISIPEVNTSGVYQETVQDVIQHLSVQDIMCILYNAVLGQYSA